MGEMIVLLVVIVLAVSVALRIRERWPFIVSSDSFADKLMMLCRAIFDKEEPFVEAIAVKQKELTRHQYIIDAKTRKTGKRYKQMLRMRERLSTIAKNNKLDIALREVWSCLCLFRGGNQVGNDCIKENGITKLTFIDKDSCKIVIDQREYMIRESFSHNNYEGKRESTLTFELDGEVKFQTLSVISDNSFSTSYGNAHIIVLKYSGNWPLDLLDMFKATSAVRAKWSSSSDERAAERISENFSE